MSHPDPNLRPATEGHISPFGQAVERLRLRVATPDEQVVAGLDGWYDVWVAIRPGHAERVGHGRIESQLGQVARLLFAERTREYYRLYSLYLDPDPIALQRNRERVREGFENETATGTAAGGDVEVFTVGMHTFTVRLAPGLVDDLGSEGLSRACTAAARNLVDRWLDVVAGYKRRRQEAYR